MRKRIPMGARRTLCFSTFSLDDERLTLEEKIRLTKVRVQNFLDKQVPKPKPKLTYSYTIFGEKVYISPSEVAEYESKGVKVTKEYK